MKARIIVNGRTGTVIMGENVRIASVAVAHGNISVEIKERKDVSQPRAFSDGETVVTPDSEVNVTEENNRLILMPPGTSLGDIVKALNAIGVTPRDLISILDAMRTGGALHAELEII
jgi:flagellar P-ring protein precursor FlgI